jgi:taurine transport system ATP-binding protein
LPGIAIDRLSMVYALADGSEVHALEDVSLEVEKGEIVSVLGPSGCGKTTLLNIVAGFLAASAGEVRVGDRRVTGPGRDRGMVFQQGALFEWLTVEGNVGFGPRMAGRPRAETAATVARLLDTVGLTGFAKTPIYQLSGGMQQRVALARCLANDPEVILMDEPLGALDALTRERMQGLVLKLWKEFGKTILLITHSVEEALFLGERVVVMAPRPGRIREVLRLPFAERGLVEDARAVKASPEFVAARERVLAMIWEMEEAIMGPAAAGADR